MAMEKGKTVGGAMKGHKVLEVTLQSLPPPLRNLAAAGSSKQVVAQSPISSNCYPQAHSMAITHKSSHPQLGHWPTT